MSSNTSNSHGSIKQTKVTTALSSKDTTSIADIIENK